MKISPDLTARAGDVVWVWTDVAAQYCGLASQSSMSALSQLLGDESLHLGHGGLCALEELELGLGAHEIVLGILCLVVSVAVDIVSEEAHGLHIGEEAGGVGQVLDFDGCEEATGALEVSLGEGLKDAHIEVDVVEVLVVFGAGVGG